LLTVSTSFMKVANSVLWWMANILKANEVNLFVSSVLFVFRYHSPNFLDTTYKQSVKCIPCEEPILHTSKGKAISLQPCTGPESSRVIEVPRFQDNRHMKVVRLSALRTERLYPLRKYSWYSFLLEGESTPGS
jgi:hypothetical protein